MVSGLELGVRGLKLGRGVKSLLGGFGGLVVQVSAVKV